MKVMLLFLLAASANAAPWLKELEAHQATDEVAKWHGRVSIMSSLPHQGDSMRPDIVPGDRMLWKPYTRQPIVGEIVSIDRGKNHLPMAHKVIAESEFKVLTKGINNDREDGWTSKAWVQGVLVGIVRTKP